MTTLEGLFFTRATGGWAEVVERAYREGALFSSWKGPPLPCPVQAGRGGTGALLGTKYTGAA